MFFCILYIVIVKLELLATLSIILLFYTYIVPAAVGGYYNYNYDTQRQYYHDEAVSFYIFM